VRGYYLDQANPTDSQEHQCTGDGSAYGSSGVWIDSSIRNTDPARGAASHLSATLTLLFDGPGGTAASARARAARAARPLSARAAAASLRGPVGR
jgi:hypothetical protein